MSKYFWGTIVFLAWIGFVVLMVLKFSPWFVLLMLLMPRWKEDETPNHNKGIDKA